MWLVNGSTPSDVPFSNQSGLITPLFLRGGGTVWGVAWPVINMNIVDGEENGLAPVDMVSFFLFSQEDFLVAQEAQAFF